MPIFINHTKVITEHVWNNYLLQAEETRYTLGSKDIYSKRNNRKMLW